MPPCARLSKLAALAGIGVVLAGCGAAAGDHGANTTTTGSSSTPVVRARTPATPTARDRWGTVWLCRPGLHDDPCASNLVTTVIARNGTTRVVASADAKRPGVDCFYVYPTISGEPTINANLATQFREQEVAIAQAARFSQVCRVYAPIYPQITLSALDHPARITLADALLAYNGVAEAFRDYLAHYNDGRGIVFIGHSQGAVILIRLLQQEVDRNATLRHRLVSALLLGGNVTVPKGRVVGGDFAHIPACRSTGETGCVVAYSSFTSKPGSNSEFGRTTSDAGVGILAPHNLAPSLQIMCVNPAALSGGTAPLDPYIPALVLLFLPAGGAPTVLTPWASFPGEYRAHCASSGNASWLQVTRAAGASKRQPQLTRLEDPALGLHILDVNIALGNLVQLVGDQATAYLHR